MKITTYEGPDTSKPHCGKYCVYSGIQGKRARCKFCGKPFFEEREEDELGLKCEEIKSEEKNLEKYFS